MPDREQINESYLQNYENYNYEESFLKGVSL